MILELWQQVNGKKLAITTTYNFLQFLWAFVLTFLIWYNLHKGYKLWRGVAWVMKLISVKCAHYEHSQHNVGDNGYHPGLLCIPGHSSSQLETCCHKSKYSIFISRESQHIWHHRWPGPVCGPGHADQPRDQPALGDGGVRALHLQIVPWHWCQNPWWASEQIKSVCMSQTSTLSKFGRLEVCQPLFRILAD